MDRQPTSRPFTGWIFGAVTVATVLGCGVWLLLAYIDAKLVHGEWLWGRDGLVLIPVILAFVVLLWAGRARSQGRSYWVWILAGGGAVCGLMAFGMT